MAKRRWEEWPGRNKFCCDGLIMMSRQTGVFYFTLILILGTMAIFFYSDSPYLWKEVNPVVPIGAALLMFMVLSNLFRTSFTDPGVIPRATAAEAAHIDLEINAELVNGEGLVNGYRPPPRQREVDVNGTAVKLKYCFTCKIFRPPRSSHCSICDNCILNFDHHWNCVGLRNYRHFYLFTVTLSLLCIYTFAAVVVHIVLNAVKETPGSLVVALICFFSIWSVLGLAGFHSYLLSSNQTTNEDIKGTFNSKRNPENYNPYSFGGLFANCAGTLCAPTPPSLIDRRGLAGPSASESLILNTNPDTVAIPVSDETGASYGAAETSPRSLGKLSTP